MKMFLALVSLMAIVLISGCVGPSGPDRCVMAGTDIGMNLSEAREIAVNSECGNRLKDTYMCNEGTGTWWIDLDITREGCNPACVVNVVTGEAEINWRCTGLLPEGDVGLANPAAVYCEDMGYTYTVREETEGSAGYCVTLEGSECPGWEYLRGECTLTGESDYTPQECLAIGGRVTNIVGGGACGEGETRAGRVTGFITPNICCVPAE